MAPQNEGSYATNKKNSIYNIVNMDIQGKDPPKPEPSNPHV